MLSKVAENKILSLLGFAQKAKKITSGDANVRALLKKNQIKLLVIADDLSEEAKNRWYRKAESFDVPCFSFSNKSTIGLAMGQSPRAIVGLLDDSFADAISKCRMESMEK